MLFLLYLMTDTYGEIQKAKKELILYKMPISLVKMSIWAFLFGVLTEWKGLKKITKKEIKINRCIIPTVIITVVSFIPSFYWTLWFGVDTVWFIEPLRYPHSHITLNVLAGILLVRSLTKE